LLKDIDIDILINNAGVGLYGKFIDSDIDKINSMLTLNISSLVELTYHLANKMVQKRQGKILNIASMAAFQPIPNFSVYAASKTFVLNFTEALNFELKPYGVTASVLYPGATATNFDKAAGASDTKLFKSGVMNATDVAKIGVKQLDNNQMTKVAGYKNKILSILSSTNPFRRLSVKIADFFVN
jgi:short-subunit dehydrogenase